MTGVLDLRSARAKKARLARFFNKGIVALIGLVIFGLACAGAYFLTLGKLPQLGYWLLAGATLFLAILLWNRYDLQHIAPKLPATQLDDVLEQQLLAALKPPLTPQSAWKTIVRMQEAVFMGNHLLLDPEVMTRELSPTEQSMPAVWEQATQLMAQSGATQLHSGVLAAALAMSPEVKSYLTTNKTRPEDISETLSWLNRVISYTEMPKQNFGGIGRDWATGFTPMLDQFSQNISLSVQASGSLVHYSAHEDLLDSIIGGLNRGSGVALIGPAGAGKSTLVHTLAGRLLEGRDPQLQYYQVTSLNAALILSHSGQQLENLLVRLFGEAINSGNIILYLQDAELFFGTGTGAFDMSQILLPMLRNRRIKIIAAFSPPFWQQLQARQPALTGSLASVVLTDPSQESVFKSVQDSALVLEHQSHLIISLEAIREAYRLSGQYMQDEAYPGKVVNLLEQSLPYAEHQALITAGSVQTAIEKIKGVKVSAAAAPEAAMLLSLEDRIHERMINQTRAVTVVASALRRGRAGVSNPNRPVGTFLFLGPTGVGKTELARSLAAIYFGDERQMIRLDMSEYQQPDDVKRLLAAGGEQEHSLLMAIRQQPFSVVLLDEIEKAHPNILNLMLQMLDEGQLTDSSGHSASFRSSIIIATSNAGSADIIARVKETGALDNFERPLIDKLIGSGQFRPELVNRFDEVVLFRPLNEAELALVAGIMLQGVNKTLSLQQISVELTPEALRQIVHLGYDPEFGARPMRRIIQKTVENAVAMKILRQEVQAGSSIVLDIADLALEPREPETSQTEIPPQPMA